ncbi:MAG: hypothetical protein ABI668_13405 [Sphingorhabdus sp.]
MKNIAILAAFAAVLTSPAYAEKSPLGSPIGKWVIYGESDPMTDKMSCIAYYGGEKFVQVTDDSFAIGYGGRGGLEGYTLRFDNDAALEMTLPSRSEKSVSAFIISDTDPRYARLVTATRLRVQAITVLSSLANDDVDLTDFPKVLARLKGPECT